MKLLEEIFYLCMGGLCLFAGMSYIREFKTNAKSYFSFAFWTILGVLFIGGKNIPPMIVGGGLVILAVISMTGSITCTMIGATSAQFKSESADRLKHLLLLPIISVAVLACVIALVFKTSTPVSIGIASASSLGFGYFLTKSKATEPFVGSSNLLRSMGAASIIPHLIAVLGAVFTTSGIGDIISNLLGKFIPSEGKFIPIAVYCLSMMLFTMVMGNSYGAFPVILTAIGYPFLISRGYDPVVVGALGIICGSCGTLMTPMAANYNIIPASLLGMQNKYTIIKTQIPFALTMVSLLILAIYLLG